jgi:hypothetical protein
MAQVEPETLEHLFWSCREVNGVIGNYINILAGTRGENISVIRYWEGCEMECNIDTMMSILVVRFIQYAIYRCRTRRRIPLLVNIKDDAGTLLDQLNKRTKMRGVMQRLSVIVRGILE